MCVWVRKLCKRERGSEREGQREWKQKPTGLKKKQKQKKEKENF